MGVIGLWSILDAGARPVRLEALAKKRLAVDASIWIYQFLKAVRDKEGNVLKNAHVVGFFRRICKLLFHGIQPVFVFDGKAPLLKKQTLRNRKVLREGGRIDVAKTAGKILAVQMRKRAIEEAERQQQLQLGVQPEEEVPDNPVYFEDLERRPAEVAEVQKQRFKKMDQYHLPELDVDLDRAGSVNDPRIMTHEELEAYAKDFDGGEDMSLYDFSKIDFDGAMFKSLPAADQYSILNAARLRSRLRMGLSTEQLTDMFPDRMAFSRFQIERVKERSDLTNRLMNMNGMNDIGVQRVASERGREYILVKNETVDGGWSLGVVNSAERPIVIDKELQQQADSEDEDTDFKDVALGGDNDGEQQSTVGMTEEDMIRFAMEESRKAQMSSTKPDTEFRPSSRRKDVRAQRSRLAEDDREDSRPLFARDESMQESIELDAARSDRPANDDMNVDAEAEDSEAEELKQALAMSLEPEQRAEEKDNAAEIGGGFVVEDVKDEDDIELPTVSQTQEATKPKDSTNKQVKFQLPFEKIDFGSSLFSRAKGDGKPMAPTTEGKSESNKPLDKIQKAMQSAFLPEGVDVEAASDSEIRDDLQSTDDTAKEKTTVKKPSVPVPSWFEEEVERPQARPVSAGPEDVVMPTFGLGSASNGAIDLTKEESNAQSDVISVASSPASEDSSPQIVVEEQPVVSHNESTATATDSKVEEAAEQDDKQSDIGEETLAPGSPDWADEEEQAAPQGQDDTEIDHDATIPSLNAEDSILDEADQTRLHEEEDLMNRMAAEEAEYARFSAELGNKRPDNYTNVEYEQDLKALKNQQRKNLRDADEVTQIMVMECQELLAQFGIPYITAASEAESQCAQLVQSNLVDGIVTDDSDVFLFGGTRVYRNMFNAAKTVECYVLSDLEREFELDRQKLIHLAHLLGSDYTEGIKKIGPVLALELIAEFDGPTGLEDFRDYVDRVQTDKEIEEDKMSAFRRKFKKTAEKLVLPENFPNPLVKNAYLNPEVDEDASNFQWGQPDVDALRSFLMRTCGWRQEYTDSQLLPVIKDMNLKLREGTQRNLTDFFSGSVGAGAGGAKKAVKSARMHNALSSLRGHRSADTPHKRARKTQDTDEAAPVPKKARKKRAKKTPELIESD